MDEMKDGEGRKDGWMKGRMEKEEREGWMDG